MRNSIFEAYREIREDKEVQELLELNWRQAVAGALVGATALTGPISQVAAKEPISVQAQSDKKIDIDKLLYALKQVESSGGVDKQNRYELGVEKYLRKTFTKQDKRVKDAIDKYGFKSVASSYGPYQILASTAYWMGFTGAPNDLKREDVSKQYVTKYINWLINRPQTKTIQDVISAYNAGLGGIGTNSSYINKVLKYYK